MGTHDTAETDRHWMGLALQSARRAAELGEVPVGAVLVRTGQALATEEPMLACTHNQPIRLNDPTAHAEMLALRAAAQRLGNYRLDDCELYVTLEPCAMCAQAMLHARLKRVVFGATEPKTGAAGSVLNLFAMPQLNHHTEVLGGVLADECAAVLTDFFKQRRLAQQQASTPLRDDALRTPEAAFLPVLQAYPQCQSASRYVTDVPALEGLRLHAMDLGPRSGPTVWLALHSVQGWWPELADWAQQRAAAGERVLLPDLLGFGQSDKPKKPRWHSLERHAQYLWAWLDAWGVGPLRVAAAPGQVSLAQAMAAMRPAQVLACVALPAQPLAGAQGWADVPYVNVGYRAAHQAWRAGAWDRDPPPGE